MKLAELTQENLRTATDDKVRVSWLRVNQWYASAQQEGRPADPYVKAGALVAEEMKRRGFEVQDSDLTEAIGLLAKDVPVTQTYLDMGAHQHQLDRATMVTAVGGPHRHIFTLPDGSELWTEEDGIHAHNIYRNETKSAGMHSHKVILPDGTSLYTKTDGEHHHELQVLVSSEDGIHTHDLELPDGKVITSPWPDEYWRTWRTSQIRIDVTRPPTAAPEPPYDDSSDEVLVSDGMKIPWPDEYWTMVKPPHKKQDLAKDVSGSMSDSLRLALVSLGYLPEFEVIEDATPIHKCEIKKVDTERQIVYGVVLEPDTEDAQGDVISRDDVETAAHNYLKQSRVVGLGHTSEADAEVVESFVVPADMEWNGQVVKAGSWVIGVHVTDPQQWELVKDGTLNSFSIGGWGLRSEEF